MKCWNLFFVIARVSGEEATNDARKIFGIDDGLGKSGVCRGMFEFSTGLCGNVVETARIKVDCRTVGRGMGE